ncbi:MAG: hypothetical protein ABSA91_15335 [Acidimicrobiales bacterium]
MTVGPSGSTGDGYLITVFEKGQNRPHVLDGVDGCDDADRRDPGVAEQAPVPEATRAYISDSAPVIARTRSQGPGTGRRSRGPCGL